MHSFHDQWADLFQCTVIFPVFVSIANFKRIVEKTIMYIKFQDSSLFTVEQLGNRRTEQLLVGSMKK